jgi:hypothetical protein
MKLSSYKLLTAIACGTFALFFAIWCIAMAMTSYPVPAIALGLVSAFLATACRIQLYYRANALIKEDWRRN